MMSIVLDTQSQPGYSQPTHGGKQGKEMGNDEHCSGTQSQPGYLQPTNERKQGKEMGNDEHCYGHPITTRLLTLYI